MMTMDSSGPKKNVEKSFNFILIVSKVVDQFDFDIVTVEED